MPHIRSPSGQADTDEQRLHAQRQVDDSLIKQLETFEFVPPKAEPEWALVASVDAQACKQVRRQGLPSGSSAACNAGRLHARCESSMCAMLRTRWARNAHMPLECPSALQGSQDALDLLLSQRFLLHLVSLRLPAASLLDSDSCGHLALVTQAALMRLATHSQYQAVTVHRLVECVSASGALLQRVRALASAVAAISSGDITTPSHRQQHAQLLGHLEQFWSRLFAVCEDAHSSEQALNDLRHAAAPLTCTLRSFADASGARCSMQRAEEAVVALTASAVRSCAAKRAVQEVQRLRREAEVRSVAT